MTTHKASRYFLFWLAWAAAIVYGSLLPFELRPHTLAEAVDTFRRIPYLDLGVVSRADWIANILLYIPLAYLGASWLNRLHWLPRSLAMLVTAGLGLGLALGVEFTQIFFAPRTVSLNDLIAETIGTALGLILWSVGHSRLAGLTTAVLHPGPGALTAGLTLYALAYLGLALFPYDFVVSVSDLQWKLLEGHYGWGINHCGSLIYCTSQWLAEAAAALPLGMLLVRLAPRRAGAHGGNFIIAVGIGACIEAAQFLIASGVSTVSGALTKAVGIGLGAWLRNIPSPRLAQRHAHRLRPALLLALIPYFALAALLNGWARIDWSDLETLRSNLDSQRYLPFYYHYFTSETQAVTSLLAQSAIYLPLGIGFWLWHASGATPLRRPPLFGLLLTTAAIAIVIEAGKLFIARAHPDPTNILIGLAAAWLGQRLCQWLAECARVSVQQTERPPPARHFPRQALIGVGLVILLLGGLGMTLIQKSADSEAMFIAGIRHTYPTPQSLPPAVLPDFRSAHPRLPAPTAAEIVRLKDENPGFLERHRQGAGGGRGKPDSAILMAYIEPGSQNLEALFQQLMDMKFNGRGHEQGKLLAQGYDWLYGQWSESQRRQLQDKLAHGCNYLIQVIRSGRFSPYNVTLYNGAAQALTACSIALYRDDPRGEAIMAFAFDLWQNRVLPVWRQVMGDNGGWHEGADMIARGIGQAIYQLPNMWRHTGGEDYFQSEPGLRGFLDFLVYRTRPDGTQIRLGDSVAFNHDVPDRLALALEYRHAAAYSLAPAPKNPVPTSWPWGPLTDNGLYDPEAIKALPLSRRFDGIGLVVMRSDWSKDATYITFKAGDSYSSFTHLDQGSFTIYKGGALAIDSGLYYKYGSDHHLNYAYQTIAHNVATVTNPDEAAAISNNEFTSTTRAIANDGGQRRIGGNIELYPHPLDVDEWNAKGEVYHTGSIIDFKEQDGVVSVTADITAAYTNKFSGEGTVSSRTRRVERYLRTFIYDRLNDLVLVYDDITKSDPTFTSRWLIHFQEAPMLMAPDRFLLALKKEGDIKQPGGILEGEVLLPQRAQITTLGGPGKEFWVDGKNYDDDGGVFKALRSQRRRETEAGAWRIEVTPGFQTSQRDHFLVALDPKLDWSEPPPAIQCSQQSGAIDCVVRGNRDRVLRITAAGIAAVQ